jgi:hypothetical protein
MPLNVLYAVLAGGDMYYVVYVSSAVRHLSTNELADILTKSREKNEKLGLTGMLLYKDGNFIQILEGEKESVLELYESIQNDPRHKGIITLLKGETPRREFPDWSMGFKDLNDPAVHAIPGYNEIMNNGLSTETLGSSPSRVKKLLLAFRDSRQDPKP